MVSEAMLLQNPEYILDFLSAVKEQYPDVRLMLNQAMNASPSLLANDLLDIIHIDHTAVRDMSRFDREALGSFVRLVQSFKKKVMCGQISASERLQLAMAVHFDYLSGPYFSTTLSLRELADYLSAIDA